MGYNFIQSRELEGNFPRLKYYYLLGEKIKVIEVASHSLIFLLIHIEIAAVLSKLMFGFLAGFYDLIYTGNFIVFIGG